MGKIKWVGLIILTLVLVGFIGFKLASSNLVKEAKSLPVEDVDFGKIQDGEYEGAYEMSPVSAKVKTKVEDRKIIDIEIVEHDHGLGEEAEGIVKDIINEQSLLVDDISGATVSSICIKKAVEDSLIK